MNRKRVYRQNELGWLIQSSFIAAVVFGAQAFGVIFLLRELSCGFPATKGALGPLVSLPLIAIVLPLLMYPEVMARFSWNVHLDENKVWMKGDRVMPKWCRIQLPIEVKYSEILSISIERSSKNNVGQSIRTWFYGPIWSKKLYLVLITGCGKKRLHVSHYTEATLAVIIDEIAIRCEATGKKYDGRRAAQILFGM